MLSPFPWSRARLLETRALPGAASSVLVSLVSLATLLGGLGCAEEAPVKKAPSTAVDAAEHGRLEQGRKKLAEANGAITEKKFDRARKLLREALELGNESQRFEVEEVTEKLDKREAKLWVSDVSAALKEKDCSGAVKQLADHIKELASDVFTKEVRRLAGSDALKCLQTEVDDKVLASAYADARKLANAVESRTLLGQSAHKRLAVEVEATILDALRGQITDDLKAKKWAEVMQKIDEAVKKGDATPEQAAELFASARKEAAPEVIAIAQRALGQGDAPQALRQVNALIKLLRWEELPPDAAALAKDRALPADVARKREALATWVEAGRVTLKVLKRPEKRWAHGKIAITPPAQLDGASKRDIAHGAEVWIIGTTKGNRALLAGADPGAVPLTAMFDKVIGWAPVDRLAQETTASWVMPDEQLKGERVWAPLRKDEPLWELGVVTEVVGKEVSVKRVADDAVIKVTRKQLRSGRLSPGTRLVTFCTAKDQPAKIAEVLPNGNVKIKCDSGQEKEEVLASLRSKPDVLPPTK